MIYLCKHAFDDLTFFSYLHFLKKLSKKIIYVYTSLSGITQNTIIHIQLDVDKVIRPSVNVLKEQGMTITPCKLPPHPLQVRKWLSQLGSPTKHPRGVRNGSSKRSVRNVDCNPGISDKLLKIASPIVDQSAIKDFPHPVLKNGSYSINYKVILYFSLS